MHLVDVCFRGEKRTFGKLAAMSVPLRGIEVL